MISNNDIKIIEQQTTSAGQPPRVLLNSLNNHIICNLCEGYLIDATTIVECLHSFCHSCIMRHLRTEHYCPRCEMMINKAKPNIKPDATLQAIVYKLVPGLYEKELMRKRAFYKLRPQEAALATPEQRGEDTEHLIFSPNENMSLSLEYSNTEETKDLDDMIRMPKYLQCPAIFTVGCLKRFIINKFNINEKRFMVEIMYKVKTIVLPDYYTLMDVAYIYTWKREAPMKFYYHVRSNYNKKECVLKMDNGKTLFSDKIKTMPRLIKCTAENENSSSEIMNIANVSAQDVCIEKIKNSKVQKVEKVNQSTEKKCENIKLKIDLSRQNSVTIFEPLSNKKSEIKLKIKKDKSSADNNMITGKIKPNNSLNKVKSDVKSSGTINKPLSYNKITLNNNKDIVKNDNIYDFDEENTSTSTQLNDFRQPVNKQQSTEIIEKIEDEKSLFLNSFDLAPISKITVPTTPPPSNTNKLAKNNKQLKEKLDSTSPKKNSLTPIKSASSKRKASAPMKSVTKKCRSESPKREKTPILKLSIPGNKTPPLSTETISFGLAPFPLGTGDNKTTDNLPIEPVVPPLSIMNVGAKKNRDREKSSQKAPKMSFSSLVKQTIKPYVVNNIDRPVQSGTPRPATFSTGKVLPILPKLPGPQTSKQPKKLLPILPKTSIVVPKVPSINLNKLTKELNKINNYDKIKETITEKGNNLEKQIMPPPSSLLLPKVVRDRQQKTGYSSVSNQRNSNQLPPNIYPLNMRNQTMAPSPVYAPNSPQYTPNFNLAFDSTYKYVKPPTYITNFMSNSEHTKSHVYAPSSGINQIDTSTVHNNKSSSVGKELFPKSNVQKKSNIPDSSTNTQSPPESSEKQVKVQSLLDSCKINFPASLSITLTNDKIDGNQNPLFNPKRKSPVNNFIEIVKLPDNIAENENNVSSKLIYKTETNNKTGDEISKEVIQKVNKLNNGSQVMDKPTISKTDMKLELGNSSPDPVTNQKISPSSNIIMEQKSTPENSKLKQVPNLNPIEKRSGLPLLSGKDTVQKNSKSVEKTSNKKYGLKYLNPNNKMQSTSPPLENKLTFIRPSSAEKDKRPQKNYTQSNADNNDVQQIKEKKVMPSKKMTEKPSRKEVKILPKLAPNTILPASIKKTLEKKQKILTNNHQFKSNDSNPIQDLAGNLSLMEAFKKSDNPLDYLNAISRVQNQALLLNTLGVQAALNHQPFPYNSLMEQYTRNYIQQFQNMNNTKD